MKGKPISDSNVFVFQFWWDENEKKVNERKCLIQEDESCCALTVVKDYDVVFAIGPLVMMKFVCELTKKYNIKTIVSMNPIMIDGTGMCGGCRLTVDGKTKFACIDGPDFNGHLIDFDEAIFPKILKNTKGKRVATF